MVDYYSLMITAMFTGIGTATGMAIFEMFLKEKIHNIGSKIKKIPEKIKENDNRLILHPITNTN